MSDEVRLDFAEFLSSIGLQASSPEGLSALQHLREAQSSLKDSLERLQACQGPEEQMLAAVEVALSGVRLNDRKLRLLAYTLTERSMPG